jgi:hypothetical protein
MTVSSVQAEVQKLIRDTLLADTTVMSMVNGIWDDVSDSNPFAEPKEAYITIGPSDVVSDDADCIMGGEITFQLDAWSRTQGKVGCRKIVDAMKVALHGKDLDLTNNALVEIRVDFRRVIDDLDGITKHGLVMVTTLIEEATV